MLTLSNPRLPDLPPVQVEALADTGSVHLCLPPDVAEALKLIGQGEGVHWPDPDEDLSVESILSGRASAESLASFQRWLAAHPI